MSSTPSRTLADRVVRAAEAALADHSYVSAIDVLVGMGLLASSNVNLWRQGRVDSLERVIQGNLAKISSSMSIFRKWARDKGLKPSPTGYVRRTRDGVVELQFSRSGDADIEKNYRTHFVSPMLSERTREQLQDRLSEAPKNVVFQVLTDSQCSECGAAIDADSFLVMENGQPLCLPCAGLGNLEYLPAGETALTRRATKYSGRTAVVVRFSRSRKRYERQGILAEPAALEKAERECVEDAPERAEARERGAERRGREDRELIREMTEQIRVLFRGSPPHEAAAIAEHTASRGSGRVGRTAAGRGLKEEALTLAVIAAIRHNHTNYDELLASGVDRARARQQVAGQVDGILARWREGGRGHNA